MIDNALCYVTISGLIMSFFMFEYVAVPDILVAGRGGTREGMNPKREELPVGPLDVELEVTEGTETEMTETTAKRSTRKERRS